MCYDTHLYVYGNRYAPQLKYQNRRTKMSELKAKTLHMGPAQCAVDLGDGSERGEYVNQDYILQKLGRPHRAINLMYCYYPNDEGWPGRASVVHADPSVRLLYI